MITEQVLCGKYMGMSCILKPVVSAANVMGSHGFSLGSSVKTESQYVNVTYRSAVQWLSCIKVLSGFFNLGIN